MPDSPRDTKHDSEESERSLLADIFNRSPAFMAVIRGTDYRFELANERYYQLVGHRELLGLTVVEALPEVVEQGFLTLLDEVYRGGGPYIGHDIAIQLQREPGQPLETRYLDFVYQPLLGPDGLVTGILAHGVDLTERKLAEDTLRRSEASFRLLADALPQMVWTSDPDGTLNYYNRRWYEYTGMPEGVTGDASWSPVIHPDDHETTYARWLHSMRTGENYEHEYRFRRGSDGSYRWHLGRALPVRDSSGEIVSWFGTSTDIHDLRVADEALRTSEERLNAALAAAEMGTFRWEPESGAFLDFDAILKQLFDLPADREVELEDVLARVHPDDVDELRARIGRSAAEGTDFEMTYRVVLRDGSVRWLYDRAKMRQAEPGRPRHLVGACVDITKRKLAEDAARQSAQRLHAIFSQATAGIAQTDRTGRFIEANARYCQIVGRTEEELLGMQMQEITHPDDLPGNLVMFRRLIDEGAPFRITKRYLRPDGSIAWVENHISGITDAAGETEYVVVVTIDITDRMKVEEQRTRLAIEREQLLESERAARAEAEEASRMKDEFLATVSHELRTPLNAIVGWSSLLRTPDADQEMLAEGLDAIQRNARTQSRLIEDVLDVARITTGKVQLNLVPLRLRDVIASAVATVQTEARAKQIGIIVDTPEPGEVHGDSERLQQVFWNLLSNAIKFTGRNGSITIALRVDGSSAIVSITDTGSGIDPAFLPYVFERFRQADARITRREGGLGLGLSIVRNLVEMHRGNVRAQSEGPGTGSTFVVELPLASETTDQGDEGIGSDGVRSLEADAARILTGRRAIVLDDDPDARRIVEATLVRCGMKVTTVPSVADAIVVLRADQSFDVVLSDIGMPDEDGFQFIRRLRAFEAEHGLKHLPAAALTAYTRDQDKRRATEAGFDRFIAKPVHPHELLGTVVGLITGTVGSRGVGSRESEDE